MSAKAEASSAELPTAAALHAAALQTGARDAAYAVLAEGGWRTVKMADIAARAGLTLLELRRIYPMLPAILDDITAQADDAMLRDLGPDETEGPVRDRLFALIMRRFDGLAPAKAALRSLTDRARGNPALIAMHGPAMLRSAVWMVEAARVDLTVARRLVLAHGLLWVMSSVTRAWLADDSADLGATMKALDQALDRVTRLLPNETRTDNRPAA